MSNNVFVQNIMMEHHVKSVQLDIIKILMDTVSNVHVMARKYNKLLSIAISKVVN